MSTIEVQSLTKTFTVHKKKPGFWGSVQSLVARDKITKHAVRNVSFSIDEGEIVGLVGANGAGKTTIVKMLAGIIYPTSGDANILGYRPWERDNRLRSKIALIMGQKAQLWWDLPAADCFLLLREIYQIPVLQYEAMLGRLVSVLGVQDQMNIQVRRLSLGERMKMELIAALLHSPRVVFLDEPTIGLDLNAQRSIREFILEYQAEHRPAMILTSHYMEDIERLCKRIMIIRDGEIVYDGDLARVVETYAPHKVVSVHIEEGANVMPDREQLQKIGTILDSSSELIRLHVPRRSVAQAATFLVNQYPVSDLQIEEEDIGVIIANIIGSAGEVAT